MRRRPNAIVIAAFCVLAVCAIAAVSALLTSDSAGGAQPHQRGDEAKGLPRVPAARLQSSISALPSGAPSTVAFERTAFDRAGLAIDARDGLRASRGGIYAISAGLRFPADPRGIRALFIALDDGTYLANQEDSANADPQRSTIYTVATLARLRRGETVRALAFQDTGEPMALLGDARSFLAMHFVSR